jgi:predicted amidophosphoribosyltransferase
MARSAARRLRSRYPTSVAACLVQARGVRDQAGLTAPDRHANLAGGLRLRAPVPTRPAVLVDDLVTTGSSLTEAARVLRRAGVPLLGAATVAATELRPRRAR